MTTARVAGAMACFTVFAGLALAMAASARSDWREGRRGRDRLTLFFALEQWWSVLLAGAVAIIGTALILVG